MYKNAVRLTQLTIQYYFDLAVQDQQAGRLAEAAELYRKIVAVEPGCIEARRNLGNIYTDLGQFEAAINAFGKVLALTPDDDEACYNYGNALLDAGRLDEAVNAYQRAILLNPGNSAAHYNLGRALSEAGRIGEAIAAYRAAIARNPDDADAHTNLALGLLALGEFREGWDEYEWRWKSPRATPPEKFAQPRWDGSASDHRVILIQDEQGRGDTLQFIRYLPLVAARCGKVVFACHADLIRLLENMAFKCQIVARGTAPPPFDAHCPLASLPRLFETTIDNLPREIPYLFANSDDIAKWQERFAGDSSRLKIGLTWAGNPGHRNDHNRSINLADFAPLAHVPGVEFFSLQKGAAAEQTKTPPPGMEIVDWTSQLKDFADTASLIANLDLIISVDTAVIHLAGAMGKPVWALLPFAADWRWLLDRHDSPWYPTMRLFRQPTRGDWQSVMDDAAHRLAEHRASAWAGANQP